MNSESSRVRGGATQGDWVCLPLTLESVALEVHVGLGSGPRSHPDAVALPFLGLWLCPG